MFGYDSINQQVKEVIMKLEARMTKRQKYV